MRFKACREPRVITFLRTRLLSMHHHGGGETLVPTEHVQTIEKTE